MSNLTREDLAQRLAEADRARQVLRRATLEWRAIGDRILVQRLQEGKDAPRPHRPDDGRAAGG
ncbi:MAG: hypothetical protein HZA54_01470 [Planctomycetes bacterium]|nr:hypothetical protein [Planctomycetota bacterium]